MVTSNQLNNASQISLQTNLANFINEICDTGKITRESYDRFEETINGPNVYNIEIEVKVLDENPNKKTTTESTYSTIGEDVYVVYYTSQILQQLDSDEHGTVLLKEGDQVHIYIANTNATILQQISATSRNDISTIIAEATQTCTINGM